jgi:hypothetical protein
MGWRRLRIKQEQKRISLYVDARSEVITVEGSLWFKGQHFDLGQGSMMFWSEAENASIRGE